MRCMAAALALSLYSSAALSVSGEVDMRLGCKSNPQLVGACFPVHGRLSAYNGNPTFRIWPIGTHRLLGVIDDEERLSVPVRIRRLIGFERDIFADFIVCPLSHARPGHMQFVCVEAAGHVRVQARP